MLAFESRRELGRLFMTTRSFSLRATALIGALALTGLTGCDALTSNAPTAADGAAANAPAAAALDPILANPQVGDLYASELSAFSRVSVNEGSDSMAKAYGMMKVVAVDDTNVTIITENAAWAESGGAVEELGGDLATITWDDSERIDIPRATLSQLVTDGKILRTRRMEAAAPPAAAAAAPAADAPAAPAPGKPGAEN